MIGPEMATAQFHGGELGEVIVNPPSNNPPIYYPPCWNCNPPPPDNPPSDPPPVNPPSDPNPIPQNPPPTVDPDPCTEQDIQAGSDATTLFNNSEVQNALQQTGAMAPSFPEGGFSIRKSGSDGSIYTSNIETCSNNTVNLTNYQNSVVDLHVHSNCNYPPSATDIFSLVAMSFFGNPPNLKTSYVVGNDGTQYAITVTDPSKITSFYNQINGAINQTTNNLISTTIMGQTFENSYDYFLNQLNYSPRDAFERATAAILKGSGISLLKAPAISPPATHSNFKKIGVDKTINLNGNTAYNKSDCQ